MRNDNKHKIKSWENHRKKRTEEAQADRMHVTGENYAGIQGTPSLPIYTHKKKTSKTCVHDEPKLLINTIGEEIPHNFEMVRRATGKYTSSSTCSSELLPATTMSTTCSSNKNPLCFALDPVKIAFSTTMYTHTQNKILKNQMVRKVKNIYYTTEMRKISQKQDL